MITTVLPGHTLVDLLIPGPSIDAFVAVPAVRVGELLLFPYPSVRQDAAGHAASIELDLRRWLIRLPGGLALPIECADSHAAEAAAAAFRADCETGAVGSYSPAELHKWATWWCAHHPETAVETTLEIQ